MSSDIKSVSLLYLNSSHAILSQMAVCLTLALGEWIVPALRTDPGIVAHAQQVSVEMAPTVKTLMR